MPSLPEIYAAAKDLARRGLHGNTGDPLPNLMSTASCLWINENQAVFQQLVSTQRIIERCRKLV